MGRWPRRTDSKTLSTISKESVLDRTLFGKLYCMTCNYHGSGPVALYCAAWSLLWIKGHVPTLVALQYKLHPVRSHQKPVEAVFRSSSTRNFRWSFARFSSHLGHSCIFTFPCVLDSSSQNIDLSRSQIGTAITPASQAWSYYPPTLYSQRTCMGLRLTLLRSRGMSSQLQVTCRAWKWKKALKHVVEFVGRKWFWRATNVAPNCFRNRKGSSTCDQNSSVALLQETYPRNQTYWILLP